MFILASKSPRRRELIKAFVSEFAVIPPDVDESSVKVTNFEELPGEISKLKANEILKTHPNDEILACDTVVILDNLLMGKPKTKEQAKEMLRALSGKEHIVVSGYTYIYKETRITRNVKTYVLFNELSDDLIDKYIASGSPMDKAGAYGIQDEEYHLVKSIKGSLNNVIGLPIEDIIENVKRTSNQ